jgi:hypothetical protein
MQRYGGQAKMLNKNQVNQPIQPFLPYGQVNLIVSFRSLWLNLSMWTRSFLLSIASGLPNTQAVSDRLYQIPVQIGNLIQLIFGQQSAEKFISLLSTHVIQMEAVIMAQKNGNVQAVNEGVTNLYQNATEIAEFLETINPFWLPPQWENLLFNYINMTFEESTALLSGDYDKDIQVFDRIQYQTQLIGDYMANGIIQYLTVKTPQP